MQSEVAYNGTYGSTYRWRLTVTLLSQDTANNRSLVRITPDMRRVLTNWYDWDYDDTYGSITYDGTTANRTMDYYDFRNGNNGPFYFTTSSTDVYINHNADGTKTANFQAYHNASLSTVGSATVSFNYTLPTIPRYANITSASGTAITDVGFTINFTVDATIDRYAYSLDNGSSWSSWVNGDTTSVSTAVGGTLLSATTYNWKVKFRRKDSQLETVSGTYSTTTNGQNNFLGFM